MGMQFGRLRAISEPPIHFLHVQGPSLLHLVATGLTDAQVAERLTISPRTVNRHLASIYHKLDLRTRTASAHFARAHHLV
jgi:DNA-binding NarL/FixJ family response regulator